MNEITLYLKTTKLEFENWLMTEYAAIMPIFKQKPTILFETFEFEKQERLKVRVIHSGAENSSPVVDLLKAIAQDFGAAQVDTIEPEDKEENIIPKQTKRQEKKIRETNGLNIYEWEKAQIMGVTPRTWQLYKKQLGLNKPRKSEIKAK